MPRSDRRAMACLTEALPFPLTRYKPKPMFTLTRPSVAKSLPLTSDTSIRLTEKYRPSTLSDVVGQGFAVDTLQQFAAAPYPTACLFSGDTGLGKTTYTRALASDMAINPKLGR